MTYLFVSLLAASAFKKFGFTGGLLAMALYSAARLLIWETGA